MSHIHLPDGVLPPWLWISGYLVTALLIGLLWKWRRQDTDTKRFALLGIFAALMILVMSIEIPFYHINLSVVTGIILGPALAVVASLIVNMFLAFAGHGGITVAGLNTLVVAVEMLAGYGIFRLLLRFRASLVIAGFFAVVIALALGTAASYGIIVAGAPDIDRNLQRAEAGHQHEHVEVLTRATQGTHIDLKKLAVLMFGFGAIGWVLEALLSVAILVTLNRVYPNLIMRDTPSSHAP